jgi:tetratricopeptide (TPR) repeat protein
MVRFEKALMLSKALSDRVQERRAERGLAAAARLQSQYKAAIGHLERVLSISKDVREYTGGRRPLPALARPCPARPARPCPPLPCPPLPALARPCPPLPCPPARPARPPALARPPARLPLPARPPCPPIVAQIQHGAVLQPRLGCARGAGLGASARLAPATSACAGDADAYGVIADCYTDMGEYEKAAQFYDRYLDTMNKEGTSAP